MERNGVQNKTIFKTQKRSSISKQIPFTETSEANIRHPSSFIFFSYLLLVKIYLIVFFFFDSVMKMGM